MIEGLDRLLENTDQPGLSELRWYLTNLLAELRVTGKVVQVNKLLRSRVFQVKIEQVNAEYSLVVKRMLPEQSYREQRLLNRWLPWVNIGRHGPPLLGSVAEVSGQCIWHVYEYLGQWTLNKQIDNIESIQAATHIIGQLHAKFALHPLLAECRASGFAYGSCFYTSSVLDAVRSLEALRLTLNVNHTYRRELVERLLSRLSMLWDQQVARTEVLSEYGGPETLLHGDLWTTNIFVLPSESQTEVRLIDWDHVGVGPITYDLSTYLLRFPLRIRRDILNWYQQSIIHCDWQLPSSEHFNLLCNTAECSRLANAIIWPTHSAIESGADWAFEELEEIDHWFDLLRPVLPINDV